MDLVTISSLNIKEYETISHIKIYPMLLFLSDTEKIIWTDSIKESKIRKTSY
jgi:hypothetical protein